jgi:flagellar basal body rod protein FlgB
VLNRGATQDVKQGLSELEPVSGTDATSPARSDGNNVNIDAEIAEMTRTVLEQKAATVLLDDKIAMLRSAIKEGK